MKLSLYTIEAEYLQIAELLNDNGGELTEEIEAALAINKENLTTKATNYGFVIKDIEYEITILENEIARLEKMKKSRSSSIDRLKFAIDNAMKLYGVEEIKLPNLKINFRKSTSVIVEEDKIQSKYKDRKPVTYTISKKRIGEALRAGIKVKGAYLSDNKLIQIK